MATSDLDQLLDMGFDEEKSKLGLKKSGNCKLPPYQPDHLTDAEQWVMLSSGSTPTQRRQSSRSRQKMLLRPNQKLQKPQSKPEA